MAGRDAGVFANNFMTGFSFVDAIKRNQVNDKRLAARLEEERADRSFQRQRQRTIDSRVSTLFGQQQEDRAESLKDKANAEEGDTFALSNPNATIDELSQFPNSPEAVAAIKRQNDKARVSEALKGVSTIGATPGGQSVAQPTGPVVDPTTPPPAQVEESTGKPVGPTGFEASFTSSPNRGTSGLRPVSETEFEPFDEVRQGQGVARNFATDVAGDFTQAVRATADAVYSPFRGIESGFASLAGNERRSSPSATLAEATGTIYVPADRWTDPNGEKFAQLDTAGRAKAREENQAIIREYHDRGKASDGMTLGTHEGRLLAGSKLAMKDAENADRRAVEIFSDFINPAVAGTLETMALDDPIAATQLYMEHRATGMGAAPEIMVDVDRRMLAVVQDAADQLGLEAMEHAGTTKGRVSQARLTRLQASTNVVAKQQPLVAEDANIKGGLKVGDAQRAEDVLAAITDPDRPVAQHTDGAVKAAATMVGRINPQKRINDRQIQGLATLVEAGYLNGQTAMSVMLTGQWPQNAVTIDNLRDFDGEIWATYSNGTVGMIRGPKKDAGGKVPNREITEKHLNMMETGAATVFGELDESQTNRMRGLALHNPGWLRQHYNLESPEQLMQAGRLFAQTIVLSTRELKKRQEGWFQGSEKESPTEEQIFLSEEMRNKLAAEHGVQLVPMPALKKNHGLDLELVRSNMREGDYGPELVARSQELTDEEVAYEWYVRNATPEQIAAAKKAQQE